MQVREIVEASKRLSWLLRHGAREAGVTMDGEGWARIDEVLEALLMSRSLFDAVVAQNNKKRFEVDGVRVRASQGHSATVVDRAAIEQSWTLLEDEDGTLWHGTSVEAVPSIAREGLLPISRTHVHLARSRGSDVGKRANVDVLLAVSIRALRAMAEPMWQSANGVVLVRRVDVRAIVAAESVSRRGDRELERVRALLSLRAE
jgi:putative RNA 2'-phosphotransferase